ncbi:MAG: ABC transporter ATP-binding protein, partial [Caldimicrobium sp.]
FSLYPSEILGILGESGSGKSLTALSILKLLPPGLSYFKGQVLFEEKNLLELEEREVNKIRGKKISIIFQDPLSSLNPVLTIEEQMEEIFQYHLGIKGKKAKDLMIRTLKEVGIPDPEFRLRNYPHELSGGLRQRVMIAMAIACSPKILIADEPTTALDLTIQMQVLELLKTLNQEKGLSIIFITHDLGILRWFAHRILVFYKGQILEIAPTEKLFKNPLHPYTKLLFNSYPGRKALEDLNLWTQGKSDQSFCPFYTKCAMACKESLEREPKLREVEPSHFVRCFLYE